MHPQLRATCVLALLLSAFVMSFSLRAQTVSSPTVGFVAINIQPGSDTVLSMGFRQAPAFSGKISVAPVVQGNTGTVRLQSSNIGTANAYAGSHYLFFRTGTLSGLSLPITGNTATSVRVNLDLTNLPLGETDQLPFATAAMPDDEISIIPWWTLDTLFPPGEQPADQAAAGNLPPDRKVELLLFEPGTGTGRAPSRIFYLSSAGWKESSLGFPAAGAAQIPPRAVMIVRSAPDGSAWKLIMKGNVNSHYSSNWLHSRPEGPQDNIIGLDRPVDMKLSELGIENVFAESTSTAPGDRKDELHVIDNNSASQNRQPTTVYFRSGGEWKEDSESFPESGDAVIPAEAGLIVRKSATSEPESILWVNQPNYP